MVDDDREQPDRSLEKDSREEQAPLGKEGLTDPRDLVDSTDATPEVIQPDPLTDTTADQADD